MIRIVVSEIMKVSACPSKKDSTEVVKRMMGKYPKPLQDVNEDVIGPGYHPLVKQIQARVEDVRRSCAPKMKKRSHGSDENDTEEVPAEVRATIQDTYGCINWEMKHMPLSETDESKHEKKEEMKRLSKVAD